MKNLKKMCPKNKCEICDELCIETLQYHHIVERTNLLCNNHPYNIAIVCEKCHSLIHAGKIKIIGVFPSTKPPAGRILVYIKDGVCNVPELKDSEPYYIPSHKSMKIHKGNK